MRVDKFDAVSTWRCFSTFHASRSSTIVVVVVVVVSGWKFPSEKERETICPIVSRACLTRTFLTISSARLFRIEPETPGKSFSLPRATSTLRPSQVDLHERKTRVYSVCSLFSVSFNQFAILSSTAREFPLLMKEEERITSGMKFFQFDKVEMINL